MTMRTLMLPLAALLVALLPATADAQRVGAIDPEVASVLELFDHEPTAQAAQQAALRWANLHADRVPGWYRQVRISALLPRVRVEGLRREHERLQVDGTQNFDIDGSTFTPRDLRELRRDYEYTQFDVRAWAQWELSDIVWDSDVLRVSAESQRITRLRQDLTSTITSLYFDRRQRQVELELSPPSDLAGRLRAQLAIDQLTANIDALTGGWFIRELEAADR